MNDDTKTEAYDDPQTFVEETYQAAEAVSRKVDDICSLFYDGGVKHQTGQLEKTEAAMRAAEDLLNRLAMIAQAQCHYIEEKQAERALQHILG